MKPVKSSLRLSPLRCAKRTHITTQMKRVQRANGSLAQVWGRAAPNGLPAENAAKPIWSRKNALPPRRRLRSPFPPFSAFPRPFVLRRDRHKETRNPEVNQPSSITARQPENALMAITTHGGIGTEHNASRPVWRYASNSRRDRTQDIPTGTYDRREPSTTARITHQGLYIHFELNSTARPCENAIIRLLAAHSHAERRASPHLQKSTSKQTYRKITRRD